MNTDDGLTLIFKRNNFYRRQYLLALGAFGLALLVIVALSCALMYLYKNPTRPIYFATDGVGKLIPIVPLNRANMSNEEVTAWAIDAVQQAYSYDYMDFRAQLQNAEKYFTNYGWQQYMSALSLSNNLLALQQRKQIVIAQVIDKPKILAQGILAGALAWQFQMPVLVTYWEAPYNETSKFSNALLVTMVVQRQEILKGYQGLGVVQLIAKLASQPSNQPQELSATPTE